MAKLIGLVIVGIILFQLYCGVKSLVSTADTIKNSRMELAI